MSPSPTDQRSVGGIAVRLAVAIVVLMAPASVPARQVPSPVRLLDVPYVQQTESLCGGAAAAMVMRYWGATGIRAESFASLVDAAGRGIRAEDLLADVRARGWEARSFRGDHALVNERLADRQPVVTLIEDRPGYFHFVVVVAWTDGRVIYHDPARAPFRVVREAVFEAAWSKSDRWAMLILPRAEGPPAPAGAASGSPGASADTPCGQLVAKGVDAAQSGDMTTALEVLNAAAALCPGDPAPLREAAGVHALGGRWAEAGRLARDAVARDPGDQHAWRILATSRYIAGDFDAALKAWNAAGEPRVDLVNVQGLNRTRHGVATRLLAIDVDAVLTADSLVAAGKRLSELPAADFSHLTYRPLPGGRATVEAVVIERPLLPNSRASLALMAARLATDRELGASAASPSRSGDLLGASWRWWRNRPRVAASYSVPAAAGIWSGEVFAEKQTYGADADSIVEHRRGGSLSLSQWASAQTRWQLGAGFDMWRGRGRTVSVSANVDQRLWGDRLAARGGGSLVAGAFETWTAGATVDLRSSTRQAGVVLAGGAGFEAAGKRAPLALWSGAGTGHARGPLLRAHPLLDSGRIEGDVFGRRVFHAGIEGRRWLAPAFRVIRIAPALFIDTAVASERRESGRAWHTDAGAGIRVALPGSGVLRADFAKGLRDGATALSVGWEKRFRGR